MKFAATLLLVFAVVFPYYLLSNGTFYLPDEAIDGLSFGADASLQNYFTHLFTHVGLQHLVANLLPLVFFGLLFETAAGFVHVVAVFLLAGILSSVVFTALNPLVVLVGASTGVSGLMVAATALRPKKGLALLLATFLLLSVSPQLVSLYNDYQLQKLSQEKAQLQQNVESLLAQNKTYEAMAVRKTLGGVENTLLQTTSGITRERETPTDLFVHLLGAVFGGAYVFVFLRKKLAGGLEEFAEVGEFIFDKASFVRKRKNKS
ncbi:MAG: rhomboid family intramembrane serine protease [Candidatus Norongarragalinales archaeon]